MIVHKKKNRSGTTTVVDVDKSLENFRELKTIGVSDNISKIEKLFLEDKKWISHYFI